MKKQRKIIRNKVLDEINELYKKSNKENVVPKTYCTCLDDEDRKYLGYTINQKVRIDTVAKRVELPTWNSKEFFDVLRKHVIANNNFSNEKLMDKKKNSMKNKILNVAYGFYKSSDNNDEFSIPNKVMKGLDESDKLFLGFNKSSNVLIADAAKALGLPDWNSAEFFKLMFEKYPKPKDFKNRCPQPKKINKTVKAKIKQANPKDKEKIVLEFLNQFDEKYIDFVMYRYKTITNIYNCRKLIKSMYPAFKKPSEMTLVSALALDLLDDTHALDSGKERKMLEDMLVYLYKDADYAKHNLHKNFTNISVITNNLVVNCNFRWLNLNSLNVAELEFVRGKDVYIFENTGVCEDFGNKNPDAAVICTGGGLNVTSRMLINKLIENDNVIYYSGDIDYAGIKIADNILEEFPQILLYKMDDKTYEEYDCCKVDPTTNQRISDINNPSLKRLIKKVKEENKFIFQESICYDI